MGRRILTVWVTVMILLSVNVAALASTTDFVTFYTTINNTLDRLVINQFDPIAPRTLAIKVGGEQPRVHEVRAYASADGTGRNLLAGVIPVIPRIDAKYSPSSLTDGISFDTNPVNKWWAGDTFGVAFFTLPEGTIIGRIEIDLGYRDDGNFAGQPYVELAYSNKTYTAAQLEELSTMFRLMAPAAALGQQGGPQSGGADGPTVRVRANAWLWWSEAYGFEGSGTSDFKLEWPSVTRNVGGWELKFTLVNRDDAGQGDFGNSGNSYRPWAESAILRAESIVLSNTGAFFVGGQPVTTKIGLFTESHSDWIATNVGGEGFSLSNIQLGRYRLNLVRGVREGGGLYKDYTVTAATDISGGTLRGTVVGLVEDDEVKSHDYAIEGTWVTGPLSLSGAWAYHGASETSAYQLRAETSLIPNVNLIGRVYSAGEGFAPRYARTGALWGWFLDGGTYQWLERWRTTAFTAGIDGYELIASTTMNSVQLNLTYRSDTTLAIDETGRTLSVTASTTLPGEVAFEGKISKLDNVDEILRDDRIDVRVDDITTSLSFQKNFSGVKGEYILENSQSEAKTTHTIKASYTLPTRVSTQTTFAGEVTLGEGADANLKLTATWKSPNGLNWEAGWTNYPAVEIGGRDTESQGWWVKTGISIDY